MSNGYNEIMNKITAILLVLIVASCHEDNKLGLTSTDNSVLAKRNNVDWAGTTEIHLNHVTDTLTFMGIASRPNDEVIVMKIKFNGIGSYSLIKDQGYYYSTVGGDVLTSEYKLAPNIAGQLIISKYDPIEKLIEGNFKMSLKKQRSNPPNNVDIYNFTQGLFKGKIDN